MENRGSGLFDCLEEEGKGELEISSHFLSVGGKQVKAVRLSTGGFWKHAWPTW